MTVMTCLMLSSVSCKLVLKGFSKAWYLSTASTVRVNDETATVMSIQAVSLHAKFPSPLLRDPVTVEDA